MRRVSNPSYLNLNLQPNKLLEMRSWTKLMRCKTELQLKCVTFLLSKPAAASVEPEHQSHLQQDDPLLLGAKGY